MRFKKGDRVRALVDWCRVKKGDKYVVDEAVRDKGAWINVKGWPNHYMTSSEIELVEDNWDFDPRKAQPLKIEAGRFYKTRDGQKVGPMVRNGDAWTPNDGKYLYLDDGLRYFKNDRGGPTDLVAEWTSSCAAAQIDNLRDEYGPVVKPVAAGNDNGKPKFKVGDRVRALKASTGGIVIKDDEYTVTDLSNCGDHVHFVNRLGDRDGWGADNFELVTPPSTPAIVCLIKDGQPRPSTEPHVHPSRGHAGDEAARLARKYPGKEFGVYELVDTRQVAKPTYQHEWQRLAANGLDESAASELAKLAGLPWEVAHQAVLKAA